MTGQHLPQAALEAVLFIADEPIPTADLAVLFELPSATVERTLEEMARRFDGEGRGIVLRRAGGGWRLATHPETAPYLERFVGGRRSSRLSQAALETLAIVAYRQPISRGQISEIRGVSSDGVLRTLVARGVVEEVGKDSGPGQAILYGTTNLFLEKINLNSLSQLPSLADLIPDTAAVERMESGLGPGL
jgi:segregation and condensation protein B